MTTASPPPPPSRPSRSGLRKPAAQAAASDAAVPIRPVTPDTWEAAADAVGPAARAFAKATGFDGKPGRHALLPGPDGRVAAVLFGAEEADDPLSVGRLATALPAGRYRLDRGFADPDAALLALRLGGYRFDRHKRREGEAPRFEGPEGADAARVEAIEAGVRLARDLINAPANTLGPAELAGEARALAARFRGRATVYEGTELAERFPLVAAVGAGAAPERAPRLVDLRFKGGRGAYALTLVGKGVTFDTGGLDLKPSSAMLLMRKDMGGAAIVLGLARMILGLKLPVDLRVLVPIAENAVGSTSFRPGDVLRSRKGLTVEIGNTDAEGRLILADALAFACEGPAPDLLVDVATLTGAARVALGPELPALFTNDDDLAADLAAAGARAGDPVWRLPLHKPYDALLDSKFADLNNVSGGPFAGAITAALFLRRFVEPGLKHIHLDVAAWTYSAKPGRPEGGEAQTARALLALLEEGLAARAGAR